MNFDCGVYSITSPSGKQYIGQALRFRKRWGEHRSWLRAGKHHCEPLQKAWTKYGEDAMVFAKIAIVPPNQLDSREQEQIDARHSRMLYNIALVVTSPMRGRKHTPETRARMSASLTGEKHPMFGKKHAARMRELLSIANKGKTMSAETRKKMSTSRSGEKNHNFGKVASAESRAKMSAAQSGGKSVRARAVICVENGIEFETMRGAAAWLRENGHPKAAFVGISLACSGKLKTSYGYHWSYADDPKFVTRGLVKVMEAA